jgi:hypothetical protein
MRKSFALVVPLGLALIAGASALVTSTAACACLSSAQVVAMAAGLNPSWEEASEIDHKEIEVGLKQNFVGQKLDPRELFPSEHFGCTTTSSVSMECFAPTHESWALSRGWFVKLQLASDGTVVDISVTTRWGLRPNNSFKPTPLLGAA